MNLPPSCWETSLQVHNGTHAQLVAEWLCTALPAAIELGELAESSHRTYKRAAEYWMDYLQGRATPTPANVKEWVAQMRAQNRSLATIATYLAAIKAFYNWTESLNHYPAIARAVRAPRVCKDTPLPCPTSTQISAMYHSIPSNSLKGLRDRALLSVMYSTALRCVSLHRATVADLDLTAGTLKHQPKGHRAKDAVAVLSATAIDAVSAYLSARASVPEQAPLFDAAGNRRSKSHGLSERAMRALVLELSEEAGLARRSTDGSMINPGHYSAHSIRRASITIAAEHLGMEAAQTLAGHASMDTTRRAYARVNKYRQLKTTASILDL